MAQDFNPPSPELSRSRPDQDNPSPELSRSRPDQDNPSPELSRSRPDQDNPLGRPRSQTAQCKKRLQMYPVAGGRSGPSSSGHSCPVTLTTGRSKARLAPRTTSASLAAVGPPLLRQLIPAPVPVHAGSDVWPGERVARGSDTWVRPPTWLSPFRPRPRPLVSA